MTISMGVYTTYDNSVTAEACVQRADEAMYEVKNNGRNRDRLASAGRVKKARISPGRKELIFSPRSRIFCSSLRIKWSKVSTSCFETPGEDFITGLTYHLFHLVDQRFGFSVSLMRLARRSLAQVWREMSPFSSS